MPIKDGDTTFAFPVGTVQHNVIGGSLVINQTIEGRHLLHEGTVMRFAFEQNDKIYVRTLGFGQGRFPGPNFTQAPMLWGAVDNRIRQHFK